ncbi:putative phage-type endonuclease [Methylobacillus rhizosphaerae]|uniref:Putative phage-type endonuclease n=1 Tax=Methylobacillus rhizosphaerae TaxID=551994 RepID=A0A239AT01_9PROT|nr:YqaJ viral recombinase family protein [Methylobacillus rhizosphaerae]SNR98757.1 putative phage-type endonuclease [Methylobacillus rhizosphaerae]
MNTSETIVQPDRTKFIGGSDVAAILGISPWKSIVDLYLDKITPRVCDGRNMAAKRRGSRLEPYILDMIREEHGLEIVAHNKQYQDSELSFLACEIDFEYFDNETGKIENGEIKTVHPFKAKEWGDQGTDSLPIHYVAQNQHGIGIMKRDRCRVFALIGDELKSYVVERDDETIQALREHCSNFWNNHVLPQIMPPLDYKHKDIIETLKRLYPGTDGTVLEASAMHEHWRAVYETAKDMVNKYEGILDGARAHLLSEMGQSSAIRFEDGKAFTRKVINKKGYVVEHAASQYVDFRLANFKE